MGAVLDHETVIGIKNKIHTLLKHKELNYICFYKLFFQACLSLGKVHLQVFDDILKLFNYRLLKDYIANVSAKENI